MTTTTTTYTCESCGHDYEQHTYPRPGGCCHACLEVDGGVPCFHFRGLRPAVWFDDDACPWWCSDHQDPGRVDPEAHRGQIQVPLGAPMAALEGASVLSVGMHHDASGLRSIDLCAVAPWGDVLGGLSPRAARRLAGALVVAADAVEGVER